MGTELHSFSFDGLTLRYRRAGSGAPMVLLHNGGTSHVIWSEMTDCLDGVETFALDLHGFGDSTRPATGYELQRYVDVLAAFIQELELAPVTLVGNCLGSATSLLYAVQNPHSVHALILFNTLTMATFAAGKLGTLNALPRWLPFSLPVLSRVELGAALGRMGVRAQLGESGRARGLQGRPELTRLFAQRGQSHALLELLKDLPNYRMLDELELPSDFPAICTLWGLQNNVLSARAGQRWVDSIRPVRQEWLQGCGHLAMLEEPERCAAIINEFLESTLAGDEVAS